MADTRRANQRRRWNFDDVVVNAVVLLIVLVILTISTGTGWLLGVLVEAVFGSFFGQVPSWYGKLLGGSVGFGCTLYVLVRKPKLSSDEAREREMSRRFGKIMCLAATQGIGVNEVLEMKGLDPELREFVLRRRNAQREVRPRKWNLGR